jgi:hypothetical protein
MSYTTVDAVCAMFPAFTRNGPKGPSDTTIQFWVDDIASDIRAILQRRFEEAWRASGYAAWEASLNADQVCIAEKINRYGACAQLATAFETAGITAAARVAKDFGEVYEAELNKLNARDKNGKPVPQGGDYDYLFDSQAKVETPRPQLGGVSGGDQQPGQSGSEGGQVIFKKYDRREM